MLERRDNYKLSLTSEEAAEWFVRLKDEPRTADRRRYLRWLRASPENTAEALRMGQLFRLLQDSEIKYVESAQDQASNVVDLPSREGNASPALQPQAAIPAPNTRAWRIAAGFAALAVSTLVLLVLKAAWIDRTIETDASEWQTQVLSDGSIVNVGPRTQLRMEFGDNRRFVHLARGEALFQVAKDPTRPFVVGTALASIRAVGTQFGVTRLDGRTVVTVQEGVVAVSQRDLNAAMRTGPAPGTDADEPQTVTLTAGEQVTLSGSWPVEARKVDAERELAWAQRRLIFDNVTVAEAVDAFNRRNRMQIVVEDPSISARTVDGVFNAADPESFAQFLSFVEPVIITKDGQRWSLRIRSAAPPGERQTPPSPSSESAFGTLR